jgi:hypothetical protein
MKLARQNILKHLGLHNLRFHIDYLKVFNEKDINIIRGKFYYLDQPHIGQLNIYRR